MKSNTARFISALVLVALCSLSSLKAANLTDSVGIQRHNSEVCVLHQVSTGETLYAISKRYNVSLDLILQYNPFIVESQIGIGQIILIPRIGRSAQMEAQAKISAQEVEAGKARLAAEKARAEAAAKAAAVDAAEAKTTAAEAAKVTADNNANTTDPVQYSKHTVKTGETLFSLSKRYSVDLSAILAANEGVDVSGLRIGQEILIPVSNGDPTNPVMNAGNNVSQSAVTVSNPIDPIDKASIDTAKTAVIKASSWKYHKVKKGETLYSISGLYTESSMEQIVNWNKLRGAKLRIGQRLKVALVAEDGSVIDGAIGSDGSVLDVSGEAGPPKVTTVPVVEIGPDERPNFDAYSKYPAEGKQFRKERGVATWLTENTTTNGRKSYYALHNQAPIGSVLKVKNLMNNREVYAKVIGRLPENKLDERSLVKLSYNAADELGALDARFLVEIDSITK